MTQQIEKIWRFLCADMVDFHMQTWSQLIASYVPTVVMILVNPEPQLSECSVLESVEYFDLYIFLVMYFTWS